MAILGGNLSIGISIKLRSRALQIPWVKKASVISCCRAYGSSGPVRYIPNKSSYIKETEATPPMESSKDKEMDNCSDSGLMRDRISQGVRLTRGISSSGENSLDHLTSANIIFKAETAKSSNMFGNVAEFSDLKDGSDHELEFQGHNMIEDPEEVINEFKSPWKNDHFEQDAIGTSKTKQDAEKMAIETLAKRAFTAVELRKKLHRKGFPLDIIEGVINDFQSRGLINDYLYAETFSRSRWSSLSWGPRRIKQVLLQKGVSGLDAEKAIKLVFEHGDFGGDQESSLGMSKLSMDHLFVQASKQWLRGRDVSEETRKSRIIRWLQYRGFNWGVISFILKKLESRNSLIHCLVGNGINGNIASPIVGSLQGVKLTIGLDNLNYWTYHIRRMIKMTASEDASSGMLRDSPDQESSLSSTHAPVTPLVSSNIHRQNYAFEHEQNLDGISLDLAHQAAAISIVHFAVVARIEWSGIRIR
ncbi:hypothetical protein HHK36_003433 [Tetracentron sinense]|uniref:Regulatory protein RecX n=1 Tax=Tetracentron sinense TaxID=13715 RepID=A0A835DPC0_TETSI|nr:hypothetical protein HHK36_003433 [Tetracentron sinense]